MWRLHNFAKVRIAFESILNISMALVYCYHELDNSFGQINQQFQPASNDTTMVGISGHRDQIGGIYFDDRHRL